MPKRRVIVLGLLAFSAIAGVAVACRLLRPPPDPVYQGKRLSEWLNYYAVFAVRRNPPPSMFPWSCDSPDMQPVTAAIRAMGTNTLPFLLAHIHGDSIGKQRLIARLGRWRPSFLKRGSEDPYSSSAILALNTLGAAAKPALPELMKREEETPGSYEIRLAILALGTNGAPALEKLRNSANANVRSEAITCLYYLRQAPLGLPFFVSKSKPSKYGPPLWVGYGLPAPGIFPALTNDAGEANKK